MSAVAQKKELDTKNPARPEIFRQMLESRIWTNRLDKQLQSRLKQLKDWVFDLESRLSVLKSQLESSPELRSQVQQLEIENLEILQGVVPELYRLYVKCSENAVALDSDIIQLTKYNHELENLVVAKLELKIRRKIKSLVSKIQALLGKPESVEVRQVVPGELDYKEVECMPYSEKFTRFANVNNEGTPLALYPKWVTVFHHEGKRYGSPSPAVSDCVPKIIALDSAFPLVGKKVLELGSFEGANTKQLSDSGAASVLGIEANPEFYTKSLLVKNFFELDRIDFIYGNCVDLLRNHHKIKNKTFDLCFISGILYHMEDPLELIDLASHVSNAVYVWTQVADETFPKAEWQEMKDAQGRSYQSKRNVYTSSQKWGGVSTGARWLSEESMKMAFTTRGYELSQYSQERTGTGLAISFLGIKKS